MKKTSKESTPRENIREFLLKNIACFEEKTVEHQWPWEIHRWHELVFCILSVMAYPPILPSRSRILTYVFADLRLLDIAPLARQASGQKRPEEERMFETVIGLLVREGLEEETARHTVTTIAEAAAVIQTQHNGQIQKYLRGFGKQILEDAEQKFSFSKANQDQKRLAFTLWIQNVLNMPVGADIPAVRNLCKTFGVSVTELYDVADELGINLALLDDVILEITSRTLPA
jgi:hypothetical protein